MENRLNKIADYLKYKGYTDDADFIRSLIESDIKSESSNIKRWVPTDAQMDALFDVLHPDEPNFYELKSLYKDLKTYKNGQK